MRIALVIEWIDPWRGGAETSTTQFLHHLKTLGVRPVVFTRSESSGATDLELHTVEVATRWRHRATLEFAHRSAEAISAGRFDLVHAISPCPGADVYEPRGGTVAETLRRNLAIRRPGLPRLLKRSANHFNLKQRKMLAFERRWLTSADAPFVIALSDYVARQLQEHYFYRTERVCKVFNGVDVDHTPPDRRRANRRRIRGEYGIADDQLLALMVAHNLKLKGLDRWIGAMEQLRRRGEGPVRSLVVGKGIKSHWRRRVRRAGLEGCLIFAGPQPDVHPFFHAADLLVHPTYYDPCSRVVLEAMSAGLPTITTRFDGASEAIEPGVSGFVLDEQDCIGQLAERVNRLRDSQTRVEMGKAAAAGASQFTMRAHAEGVVQVYRRLLEKT